MKKIIIIFVLVAIATSAYSQRPNTVQNRRQVRLAEAEARRNAIRAQQLLAQNPEARAYWETKKLQRTIDSLQKLILSKDTTDGLAGIAERESLLKSDSAILAYLKSQNKTTAAVRATVDEYWHRQAKYDRAYDSIMYADVTNIGVPKEMTPRQENRRTRANVVRREELVYQKLASNPVLGNGTEGLGGIISNQYIVPVIFKFTPQNGGESKSILVEPQGIIEDNLIPGLYLVSFWDGGRQLGHPIQITVNAAVMNYNGLECHWFVYMPRF